MSTPNDNEDHQGLLGTVNLGYTVVLSETDFPAARVQVTGSIKGGDLVLQEWKKDADGDWHYAEGIILLRGTLPALAKLLRDHGYHAMAVRDDLVAK